MELIWMLVTIGLVGATVFLFIQVKNIQHYQRDLESQLALYIEAMDAKNEELLVTVESLVVAHTPLRTNVQVEREESVHVISQEALQEPLTPKAPAEPTDDVMDVIYALDQQGLSAVAIAERLGRPQSEINLLIYMTRKERVQ